MNYPESHILPSPECQLASLDEVTHALTVIHDSTFKAAAFPMTPPDGQVLRLGRKTVWTMEDGDVGLEVTRGGQFDSPASRTNLASAHRLSVVMTGVATDGGQRRMNSFTFRGDEGGILVPNTEPNFGTTDLTKEEHTLGNDLFRAFVGGSAIAGVVERVNRSVYMAHEDGRSLVSFSASEETVRSGDEPTAVTKGLSIQPVGGTPGDDIGFLLDATFTDDRTTFKYRDLRDYDGPFGVRCEDLFTSWGVVRDGGVAREIRSGIRNKGRSAARVERDEAVDRARNALTVGRLDELADRCGAAVQTLIRWNIDYEAAVRGGSRQRDSAVISPGNR